ncbi:hypothetical protein NFI96_011709, partial [Prochilodus magdalenae]
FHPHTHFKAQPQRVEGTWMRGSPVLQSTHYFIAYLTHLHSQFEHLAETCRSMAHIARTQTGWISALVVVAITSSCVTWLFVQKVRTWCSLTDTRTQSDLAYVLHCQDELLAWEEECCSEHLILEQNQTLITVKEKAVYLIYLQVTYSLKKGNDSIDLQLFVDFNFTESSKPQELLAAFDTRKLTEQEQDARLSAFFLLNMQAMEKLSVRALPKNQTKCAENQPFSSYISIVKYADWKTS